MLRPSSTDSTHRGQAYDVTDRTKRFNIRQQLMRRKHEFNADSASRSNADKAQTEEQEQSQANMISIEQYLNPYSPTEPSVNLNVSSDTLEAIEHAEKLIHEARQKIVEANYNVPWLDVTSNGTSLSELDESELHIRDIVRSKIQEAAKGKKSPRKKHDFYTGMKNEDFIAESPQREMKKLSAKGIEKGKTYQSSVKVVETCRKCLEEKMENKLAKKYKPKTFNQVNDSKVKTNTAVHTKKTCIPKTINNSKTNSKTQLSVRNVSRLDLIPNSTNNLQEKSKKTVKTFVFQHESCEQAKTDGSLIDVAIQTSFREVSGEESAELNQELRNLKLSAKCNAKNPEEMLESHGIQQQVCQERSRTQEKLQVDKKRGILIDRNINSSDGNIEANGNSESRASFIKFLCQVTSEECDKNTQNPSKILHQFNDSLDDKLSEDEFYNEFCVEQIDLDAPHLVDFDKILSNVDKNIEKMIKDADKLENLFLVSREYNKIDNADNGIKKKLQSNERASLFDKKSIFHQGNVVISTAAESLKNQINFPESGKENEREEETSDKSEENEISNDVRFILKPRSRISSYESVSSDVFSQQARFSTPLNNYRTFEGMFNIDKKNTAVSNDNGKFFVRESRSRFDLNTDLINEKNVFITRNKFSSASSGEKCTKEIDRQIIDDKAENNDHLEAIAFEEEISEHVFPEYFVTKDKLVAKNVDGEKIEESAKELSSTLKSSFTKNITLKDSPNKIDHNFVRISNNEDEIIEKNHEERSEKSLLAEKMSISHHLHTENSNIQNINNKNDQKVDEKKILTPESSKDDIRDRTSLDISGVYLESFEESISDLESTSKEYSVSKNENLQLEHKKEDGHESKIKSIIYDDGRKNELSDGKNDCKVTELKENQTIKFTNSFSSAVFESNKVSKSTTNSNDNKDNKLKNTSEFKKPDTLSASSSSSIIQSVSLRKIINTDSKESSKANETKVTSSECSEGEIRLPSTSCSYSIGEVRIAGSKAEELKGKIKEVNYVTHGTVISNSPEQSLGELLETDIESTSSLESRGQIA